MYDSPEERSEAPAPVPIAARAARARSQPQQRFAPAGWDREQLRSALTSELGADAPPEPPVRHLEDLPRWRAWAHAMLERVHARTHPRERLEDGSFRPFPVWSTSPRDMGRVFGAGLRLYFDLLRFLCGFFVLGLLCSVPSLRLNVTGGRAEARPMAERVAETAREMRLFVFPQGYLYLTSVGPRAGCASRECLAVSTQTMVLDAVFVVFLLWGLHTFSRRIGRVERHIDMETTSISDYSLQLRGYPDDVDPLKVKRHVEHVIAQRVRAQLAAIAKDPKFASTKRGRATLSYYRDLEAGARWSVSEVVPLRDNFKVLKAAVEMAPLEAEAEFLVQRARRLRFLDPLVKSSAWCDSHIEMVHDWEVRRTEARVARLLRRVNACRAEINAHLQDEASRRVVSVIVSFHFEEGRIEALGAFANDPLRKALARAGCKLLAAGADTRYHDVAALDGGGPSAAPAPRVIHARQLPEPADLVLENFAFEGRWETFWRRRVADLGVVLILAAGFVASVFAEVESNRAAEAGAVREVGSSASFIAAWASLIAVIANAVLRELIVHVVAIERQTLRSDVQLSIALKMTVAQVANMALIPPLVSMRVPGWLPLRACTVSEDECPADGVCCLVGSRGLLFRGSESDVSAEWLAEVGSQIQLTMTVQLVLSLGGPLLMGAARDAYCRLRARNVVTLDGLVRLFHGSQLEIADRYGELLAYAAVVLIYAPGMPLLYVHGIVYTLGLYWVDKWGLLRRHPHPPPYDTSLAELAVRLLPAFVLAHCLFALRVYALTPPEFATDIDGWWPGGSSAVSKVAARGGATGSVVGVDSSQLAQSQGRAQAETAFLWTAAAIVIVALLFGRILGRLLRSARALALDLVRPVRIVLPLEGNPKLADAVAGCDHPNLRRDAQGQLLTPADVHRAPAYDLLEWLSPMRWAFVILGIHLARPSATPEEYMNAAPVRVHLNESIGQQSTYAPDKNPYCARRARAGRAAAPATSVASAERSSVPPSPTCAAPLVPCGPHHAACRGALMTAFYRRRQSRVPPSE